MTIFDLRERIFEFVQEILNTVKDLPNTQINKILIQQIVRSATSIGANYEEADGTPTKKDFSYKMSIVKKEAKETKYWIKLIRFNNESRFFQKLDTLSDKNEELIRIIATIIIKSTQHT